MGGWVDGSGPALHRRGLAVVVVGLVDVGTVASGYLFLRLAVDGRGPRLLRGVLLIVELVAVGSDRGAGAYFVGGLHDLTSILLSCIFVVVGHELHLTR